MRQWPPPPLPRCRRRSMSVHHWSWCRGSAGVWPLPRRPHSLAQGKALRRAPSLRVIARWIMGGPGTSTLSKRPRLMPPLPSNRSGQNDLHPSVLGFAHAVSRRHKGGGLALAHNRDLVGRHAQLHQGILHGSAALLRELLVVGGAARAVGMAGQLNPGDGQLLGRLGRLADDACRLRGYGRRIPVEEDKVRARQFRQICQSG